MVLQVGWRESYVILWRCVLTVFDNGLSLYLSNLIYIFLLLSL